MKFKKKQFYTNSTFFQKACPLTLPVKIYVTLHRNLQINLLSIMGLGPQNVCEWSHKINKQGPRKILLPVLDPPPFHLTSEQLLKSSQNWECPHGGKTRTVSSLWWSAGCVKDFIMESHCWIRHQATDHKVLCGPDVQWINFTQKRLEFLSTKWVPEAKTSIFKNLPHNLVNRNRTWDENSESQLMNWNLSLLYS